MTSAKRSLRRCARGLRGLITVQRWLAPLCVIASFTAGAQAQVVEPNGVSVPVTLSNGETTLQAYFDSQMEGIDALKEANFVPGVFAPQCDFSATLVLSQSGAQAGIAWYNVPPSRFTKSSLSPTTCSLNRPVGKCAGVSTRNCLING